MKQTCSEVMVRTSSPWVSSGSLDVGGTIVFGPRARAGTRAFDILTAIRKGFAAVVATDMRGPVEPGRPGLESRLSRRRASYWM
jgi:hypothetical protein